MHPVFAAYLRSNSVVILAPFVFLLFKPKVWTRLDAGIFIAGNLSVVGLIISAILSYEKSRIATPLAVVMAALYVVLIFMQAVRFYGRVNNQTNFWSQAGTMFKRIGLYLFLPCFILTALLFLIVWLTGNLVL